MAKWSKAVLLSSNAATSIPGHVSGWCGDWFRIPFLPIFADISRAMKVEDVLFSLFKVKRQRHKTVSDGYFLTAN